MKGKQRYVDFCHFGRLSEMVGRGGSKLCSRRKLQCLVDTGEGLERILRKLEPGLGARGEEDSH